jgi:potassium channel subfamily K
VTILTVGFGDLYPITNVARGIVFPFSVGGIVSLGLVISSIYKFMRQIGEENIIQKHVDRMRERTMERTVSNSFDLRQREDTTTVGPRRKGLSHESISAPLRARQITRTTVGSHARRAARPKPLHRRNPRVLLLREEKDRFEAMRRIQARGEKFRRWAALLFSVIAFGILWCIGAVVFWRIEKNAQGMTYFQALYFCYISLLTIGYGDLAPKTNAGRCFFFIWSLIAVPTMTILVSDMGDTVVNKFKEWSNSLADFTVLPKHGIWQHLLVRHPWLLNWLSKRAEAKAAERRLREGFGIEDPTREEVGDQAELGINESGGDEDLNAQPTTTLLSRRLRLAIRRISSHLTSPTPKRYSYEEWVEFTQLIRCSSLHTRKGRDDGALALDEAQEEKDLGEWDWIGVDSPMVSGLSESEWLLRRLFESQDRVERRRDQSLNQEHVLVRHKTKSKEKSGVDLEEEKGREDEDNDDDTAEQDWADERRDEVLEAEEEAETSARNQVLASGANTVRQRSCDN